MTSYQRCWLLLIGTGLLALSGASCPQMLQQYANPPPRILPPSPTVEQVIEVVNNNTRQIQSFSTNQASITMRGFPSLRTSMAFQRPQRFRVRADSVMGTELDLGSNDEAFWFWVKRSQPPAADGEQRIVCPGDDQRGADDRQRRTRKRGADCDGVVDVPE